MCSLYYRNLNVTFLNGPFTVKMNRIRSMNRLLKLLYPNSIHLASMSKRTALCFASHPSKCREFFTNTKDCYVKSQRFFMSSSKTHMDPNTTYENQVESDVVSDETPEERMKASKQSFSDALMKLVKDQYRQQKKNNAYFQAMIDDVKSRTCSKEAIPLLEDVTSRLLSQERSEVDKLSSETNLPETSVDMEALLQMKPTPPGRVQCLSAYVNHSENLQKLISLGINISWLRFNPDIASHVLRMDFEKDFMPRLLFFKDLGFENEQIANVFDRNPFVYIDPVQEFEETVEYFQSKKFTVECVRDVVMATPRVLTTPVKLLDKHLGYVQHEFRLSGDQVRFVLGQAPKLFDSSNTEIKVSVWFLLITTTILFSV